MISGKIIRTFLSVYYAYMVEYRAELIFWVLSGSFPLIFLGLWNQAAQSNDLGFTPAQFAQYFPGCVSRSPVHRDLGNLGF